MGHFGKNADESRLLRGRLDDLKQLLLDYNWLNANYEVENERQLTQVACLA